MSQPITFHGDKFQPNSVRARVRPVAISMQLDDLYKATQATAKHLAVRATEIK